MQQDIYDIRQPLGNERNLIKSFIHNEWSAGHSLSVNDALLDWQHLDVEQNHYHFHIAYNNKTKNIDALLGEIPLWHFDNALKKEGEDVWLAIWKTVNERAESGCLGLRILTEIRKRKPNSIAAIGINDEVAKIYKCFNFQIDHLTHYYFANSSKTSYNLIEVSEKFNVPATSNQYSLNYLTWDHLHHLKYIYRPKKTAEYFFNRYQKHPIYKYDLLGVFDKQSLVCAFVVRKVVANNATCVRIIDVFGDLSQVGDLSAAFANFLNFENSEYIDCLNYGLPKNIFERLGLRERGKNDIVPNYFAPFVYENITIKIAYKASYPDYVIFKGDSDQDRP